jgi:ribosomal protein L7/L12
MAVSKDDILESISNMSVMEVVDLIEAMEEKFGVSAAAPVAAAAVAAGGGEAAAEEQTEFDVMLRKALPRKKPQTYRNNLKKLALLSRLSDTILPLVIR